MSKNDHHRQVGDILAEMLGKSFLLLESTFHVFIKCLLRGYHNRLMYVGEWFTVI